MLAIILEEGHMQNKTLRLTCACVHNVLADAVLIRVPPLAGCLTATASSGDCLPHEGGHASSRSASLPLPKAARGKQPATCRLASCIAFSGVGGVQQSWGGGGVQGVQASCLTVMQKALRNTCKCRILLCTTHLPSQRLQETPTQGREAKHLAEDTTRTLCSCALCPVIACMCVTH